MRARITNMTSAEKKSMRLEIQREVAEYDRKNLIEMDAAILWVLHRQLGFGPKRLRRFYKEFNSTIEELIQRYEMDDSDQIWLCTHMLKRYGVDVEEWYKEKGGK